MCLLIAKSFDNDNLKAEKGGEGMLEKRTFPISLMQGILAITSTAVLGYSSASQSAVGAGDLQLQGFNYVKAKNFPKALECFNAALKEHPSSWVIMQSVGCCHMELGQYDQAIACFKKSIEIGGLHASQCNNMGALYQRLGQATKALNWLNLACRVDPSIATDPAIQAAIVKLRDPANNPTGSLTAPDYLASLMSFKGWRKEAMPLRVYVRKNIQIPEFYVEFMSIVRDSLNQWCAATGGSVSYKFASTAETANVLCDYTDRRELVSSCHELGIDGNTEMLVKQDNSPGSANVVVLVKDGLGAKFRNRALLTLCCLHELGHALGMHGHSPNGHDVMFPVASLYGPAKLSERDKKTIRQIYR
jgi:tetratricopeptide (TPR) repeat protein